MSRGLTAALMVLLAGCQDSRLAAAPAGLEPRQVYAGIDCGLAEQPAAFTVASEGRWRELQGRLGRREIGGAALPQADWQHERLLVVSMGQRSSGGYGVALAEGHQRQGDTLTVAVEWREPAPGTLQTMALTEPCLVAALPASGYETVRVVDQAGRERFRLAVNGG